MLELEALLRPGDTVIWGQGCAEPLTLTRSLRKAASAVPGLRCFLGITHGDANELSNDNLQFLAYGGGGATRRLDGTGSLDIVPSRYSDLPHLFAERRLPIDVALVQVTRGTAPGTFHLALAAEYLMAAVRAARVVVAEVNDSAPHTPDAPVLRNEDITAVVEANYPPAPVRHSWNAADAEAIGRHVAGVVKDGATLQVGIGVLPEAVLTSLTEHNDLGVHSGAIGDAIAHLIDRGVATNAHKGRDIGQAIGGVLLGSEALFRFADRNRAISLRETSYTHDSAVLASLHRFTAINGAIEIDLTGQINTEVAAGRYVGAAGGTLDFARAAMLSPGGGSITLLRANMGGRPTIVPQIRGPVAVPRSEVDWVVTEYGAVNLRGRTLAQRRECLISIAHPDDRAGLRACAPGPGERGRTGDRSGWRTFTRDQ